ncbi:MAG: alpha/beta fold hydrolase [Raoultibacter sp.]|jgi:pimeloyl-ACP methyl ester carboxylesterase
MSSSDMHAFPEIITKHIRIRKLDIVYYQCGSADRVVVLAHGAGADSALLSWQEVLPLLAARGYTVVAPDLPGYGKSDRLPAGEAYSLPFYSAFIRDFVKALDLEKPVLGGLSLGGGITIKAALDEPELLSAIIPVDAWGLSNRLPWHRLTHWYTRSALNRWIYPYSARSRWMIRWSLEANLFGDKSKVTEALVDEVQKAMQTPDAGEPFRSFQEAEITPTGLTTSLYDYLHHIDLPVLLVHGSNDSAVPLRDAKQALPRFKHAELYVMEGCKHWPQKERPEEFVEAVDSFLKNKEGI